jgi:hypothetical protein
MSDETSSLLDITKSSWFVTLAAATWGVILRVMVGRHQDAAKRMEARFTKLEQSVDQVQIDVATIAGALKKRDSRGRHA